MPKLTGIGNTQDQARANAARLAAFYATFKSGTHTIPEWNRIHPKTRAANPLIQAALQAEIERAAQGETMMALDEARESGIEDGAYQEQRRQGRVVTALLCLCAAEAVWLLWLYVLGAKG